MAGSMKRTKKANKKATKGVKSLWKKGQSASHNPTFNKFRLEAKKRGVFGSSGNSGNSNLTQAKLAEHNKLSSAKELAANDDDLMSIGGDTAISAFTNCSLPTFNRLITNWNAGSLLHKEMIAVLAAVTDVLKTQGGKETETEYFAALMTTLDIVETDEGVTAVICLLSIVVKRLNENVLKHQFDVCMDKFVKLLLKYMNTDHGALLRNLLKVVYVFLKAKNNWTDSCCEKLKILLEFTVHPKPKVRRAAHEIVRTLIVDTSISLGLVHPGFTVITEFCISRLRKNAGPIASKDVFYILSLLEEILGVFPKSNIKSLSETILSVMTLSDSMLTSACLKALKGLFEMKPKSDSLPTDLNARIISALYEYQPNVRETHSLINWLQLMESAFNNLKRLDEKLCVGHLPKFFGKAVNCWQNDNEEVLEIVTSVLKNLLYECIHPSGEVFQQYLFDDPVNNPMSKMFYHVEEALTYKFHKAWKYILILLTSFFEVMGKQCYTVMMKCLRSLADMHDTYNFPHTAELEKAVGTAVQYMGPKIVLNAIPLDLKLDSDKPDFPRSWILPLLRDYIKKTELKFFLLYFNRIASVVRSKVVALLQEQKVVESKLYDVIFFQIWSLLPGFCNEPTDLKESFKEIASVIAKNLDKTSRIQKIMLSCLRILISKNLNNEENKLVLAKYSNYFLRKLFVLYSTEAKDKSEEKDRLAVYETCKVFLQITDKEVCKTLFDEALEKLLIKDSTEFQQQCNIDVCRAILPYVEASEIENIYNYCLKMIKDSNRTTQKKSYSVLNEICRSESKSCKSFVKEHLEDIKSVFCGNFSGLTPATRALKLNILAHVIKQLSENEKEFVKYIIPQAVLSTKENSVKARTAAFDLLVVIGHTVLKWQPNDHKGALCEYMEILFAGLHDATPHMISAKILAIGRILFEFKDKMDFNLIHRLIEITCLLLTSKSREIVVSAISCLKILFSVLDKEELLEHVGFMVKSITSISEDNQRHFRFKAKELFTRLIRKFGYEMIAKLVPEKYKKQISHIRRMEARKSRKKSAEVEDDDLELPHENKTSNDIDDILADSDEEVPLEDDAEKPSKMSRKRRKVVETVIEEHGDDIVDLMDPNVNMRLLTKNPGKLPVKKTQNTKRDVPVTKDGKLKVFETEEERTKEEERKIGQSNLEADLAAFKSNKRKRDFDDDDGDNIPDSTVTTGIHRSLERNKKKTPGAEFKAKKAGGDVKKGKLDPYAYVPLNRQMLNRRKQVKMKGQFKNLVKGAKKGAMIGVKRKMRDARKKKRRN